MVHVAMGGGGGPEVETDVVVQTDGTNIWFQRDMPSMPRPMATARRDQFVRLARLDEGQRAVLEALFEDYDADYGAALERMAQETETPDGADEGDPKEPKEPKKERQKEEERFVAGTATLAALDDDLFDSMELALDAEAASVIVGIGRGLRARERATTAASESTFVFGREESYVDFIDVVLSMAQSAEIVAATRPMIERYGETAGLLTEERLAAARETQRRMRAAARLMERGPTGRAAAEKLGEKTSESRQKVRKLDVRIRDRNRELLDEMEGALSRELGWTLRVAYQQEAFPEVYEDDLGIDDAVTAVRNLNDLSMPQGEQIEDVVNEYRTEFSRLSERMVQLRRQRDFNFSAMQMPSQDVIQGEIELERLRFDRREAGSRAILKLRLILSTEQIARSNLRELPTLDHRIFD